LCITKTFLYKRHHLRTSLPLSLQVNNTIKGGKLKLKILLSFDIIEDKGIEERSIHVEALASHVVNT